MDEDDEGNLDPKDMASLSYSRNTLNGKRHMKLVYRGVTVAFSWEETTDEGNADLDRFLKHLPTVVNEWRDEMNLRREMEGLDDELIHLLSEDD